MNEKDMKIITHLRKDARMSLTKLSKKTQIPVSTIFDRLKQKEGSIIIKHTTLLNFDKLGYHSRANIALKVNRKDRDAVKKFLMCSNQVNSIYKINHGFDFMIEGIFKHVRDLEDFIEDLENKFEIADKKSFFIIDDIQREEFMTDINLMEEEK